MITLNAIVITLITLFDCVCKTVNGNWGAWSVFGACTSTCGAGLQIRRRQCNNPAPANGGENCDGNITDTQHCNTQACPGRYTNIHLEHQALYNIL